MVKAYLRYEGEKSIGVIASRDCNVEFDHAGKVLTSTIDAVSGWNLRSGEQVRSLKTWKATERVTRLCTCGSLCAVGYSEGSVRVWRGDVVQQTFHGHRSGIASLAFSRDGHLLASGGCDTDIAVWDTVAESGLARLRGHVDQVTALVFRGERLISASKDRFVRIWKVDVQLCLQTIAVEKDVWSLALNKDQTRLIVGSDKFLRFWSFDDDDEEASFLGAVPRPLGQGNAISMVCVSVGEAEMLLCQGSGKTLELFRFQGKSQVKNRQRRRRKKAALKAAKKATGTDADAGQAEAEADDDAPHAADEILFVAVHQCAAKAQSLAWCPQSSLAVMGLSNNSVECVKVVDDKEPFKEHNGIELAGHRTGVRALAVASDDSLLMSLSSEAVKVWNLSTGRCVRTIASGYGLCGFFLAGNEHAMIGTREGHLELYDLKVGELLDKKEVHQGAVHDLADTPDGFASCSADKHLRFFDISFTDGRPTFNELEERAKDFPDECMAVAQSADGKFIAVSLLNHTVQMFFADTLKFFISLYGHKLPAMTLDFSSDSQMIATGSADKNVKLWSTQFGNCHKSLRAHDDSVMHVRFLPDTHYLVSTGRDRQVKLWDCDAYTMILSLSGHASEVLALAISKDAAFIITGGSDRQIRFWKRTSEQMFLSEEKEKALDERFEAEVEREDFEAKSEVVSMRASRRTIESVKSTEDLIEVLDAAVAEGTTPEVSCLRVVRHLNTLTSNNIYEVLLALPFTHAMILLRFLCDFFEAISGTAKPGTEEFCMATLDTPCQAALITTFVHHAELAVVVDSRPVLLRLRVLMRRLLQGERDRIGLNMAGLQHVQRVLKRSGHLHDKRPAEVEKPEGKKPEGRKRQKT